MAKKIPLMKGVRKYRRSKGITFIGALSITGMNRIPTGKKLEGGEKTVKKW